MQRRDFLKTVAAGSLGCCLEPARAIAAPAVQKRPGLQCMSCMPIFGEYSGTAYRGFTGSDGSGYDRDKLLEDYDSSNEFCAAYYSAHFGDDALGDKIAQEMRDEYESVIPGIPLVAESDPYLLAILHAAQSLAQYRVLRNYDMTTDAYAQLVFEKLAIKHYTTKEIQGESSDGNGYVSAWTVGWMNYMHSLVPQYPDSYKYTYIAGDCDTFDIGIDYTQCTLCILYKNFDEIELLQKTGCVADFFAARMEKNIYTRTKKLSRGDDLCNMRIKYGGTTTVPYPY